MRRFVVAATLVAAGTALVAAGSWAFGLLLAVLIAGAWSARRRRVAPDAPPSRAAGWLIAAAAVGGLAATGWALTQSAIGYADGFPRANDLLAVVGGVAVVAGLLLAAASPTLPGQALPPGTGATATVVVLVLAAVAAPLVLTKDRWPVRATTAAPGAARPVPDAAETVAWTADLPGAGVREAVGAGAGPVVLVGDGAIALDGTTGEPRWSYRRLGASTMWLRASVDERLVAVAMRPSSDRDRRVHVVFLDAMTGRAERAVEIAGDIAVAPWLTDVSLVGLRDGALVGYYSDYTDGDDTWAWRPPAGCRLDSRSVAALGTHMFAAPVCDTDGNGVADRAVLTRISGYNGATDAGLAVEIDARAGFPVVDVGVDPSAALVTIDNASNPARRRWLANVDGDLLTLGDPLRRLLPSGLALTPDGAVVDARSGQPRWQPAADVSRCGQAGLFLSDGVACAGDDGRSLAVAGYAATSLTPLAGVDLRAARFAAAPGAVVVYSPGGTTVVGLRST